MEHELIETFERKAPLTRRDFLQSVLSGALSAVIAALLGIPLIGFALAPVFNRSRTKWVKLGPTSAVAQEEPTRFVYSLRKMEGWLEKIERGTVYVVRKENKEFTVFSNVCTHAGCGVRWEPAKKKFLCPCHNGAFDLTGQVVGGPPPKPLTQFQHQVQAGDLYISLEE